MENASELFKFYKKGKSIGLLISPLCHPVKDETTGKLTGKMECEEHSHTPEKLGKMLADIKAVMLEHGFETEAFGTTVTMHKSLTKKLGRVMHSEEAMMDFALRHEGSQPIWDELSKWKEKYYAEGGE